MARKPIFIGINDWAASVLRQKQLFDRVYLLVRFDGTEQPIEGMVVASYDRPGGELLIVRNWGVGDMRHLCSGWDYIPIWLGCNSGVVAIWKDKFASDALEVERAKVEYRALCERRVLEREAMRAMAL